MLRLRLLFLALLIGCGSPDGPAAATDDVGQGSDTSTPLDSVGEDIPTGQSDVTTAGTDAVGSDGSVSEDVSLEDIPAAQSDVVPAGTDASDGQPDDAPVVTDAQLTDVIDPVDTGSDAAGQTGSDSVAVTDAVGSGDDGDLGQDSAMSDVAEADTSGATDETSEGDGQSSTGDADIAATDLPVCEPNCSPGTCGQDDGCGSPCTCALGLTCTQGLCIDSACVPKCQLGTCGQDDGCGNPCTCTAGMTCWKGLCVDSCPTGPCTPALSSCFTEGVWKCDQGTAYCAPSPLSPAFTGAPCDTAFSSACNADGICQKCTPPAQLKSNMTISGDLAIGVGELGRGLNSASGDIAGICVTGAEPAATCSNSVSSFHMKMAGSTSELSTALGVAASASYKGGLYSVNGSVQFNKSDKVSNNSKFLVLDYVVNYGSVTLSQPKLKPEWLAKASDDPVAFLQGCGDQFVVGATRGARLSIVYQFKGMTQSEAKALQSKLSGSGPNFGVSAELQQALSAASSSYETTVTVIKMGTPAPASGATALEGPYGVGLLCEGACFANSNAVLADGTDCKCPAGTTATCENAAPREVVAQPYGALDNWPQGASLPDTSVLLQRIDTLAADARAVRYALNDVNARLLTNAEKLLTLTECQPELTKLNDHKANLSNWLNAAENAIAACKNIYLCGPSAQCMVDIGEPPSLLLPLMDTANIKTCGPECTADAGAAFELDSFGYCTRCTWTDPKTILSSTAAATGVLKRSCRYMRPGATAKVSLSGWAKAGQEAGKQTWLWWWLEAGGLDGAGQLVNGGGPNGSFGNAPDGFFGVYPSTVWLEWGPLFGEVKSKAGEDGVSGVWASLYKAYCQTVGPHNGYCVLEAKVDICDIDKTGGCP